MGAPGGALHIATVVGARPQFIKAATVSRIIRGRDDIRETLIHTGQHYDDALSGTFFRELELAPPAFNLGVGSLPHGAQTARMLLALEPLLQELRPALVLVYGDTNSTLAGALTAAKLGIPVAHVEAGLRSFARAMPEEINRVLTDHLSTVLFPPTAAARERLAVEGLGTREVIQAGDVMYDAALHAGRRDPGITLGEFGFLDGGYLLATVHRAENTDDPARLAAILQALEAVAEELPVRFPVHPRTRAAIEARWPGRRWAPRLLLEPPAGYFAMQELLARAAVVVTDSGGVQKEAYFHGRPCVTVRHETEWVELVQSGWNRLVPPEHPAAIVAAVRDARGRRPAERPAFYGDGRAAERIVEYLVRRSG